MSAPTPPVQLHDHCSVIYNNTLYTYQVNAFQSLPLQDGAQWSKLPMGIATNGSTCVFGTSSDGQDSLYVVGGVTTPSTTNYSGLQRFSFGQKKWEECAPTVNVTSNRQYHGSTFLNSSASILIYAGSQDNNFAPSSQTFLVSTTPPFNVRAFSSHAPPVINPLVMPWNASHALMLGGDSQNKKLFTFGPDDGWQQLNVSLSDGLNDSSKVQAVLEFGSDGSKVLEMFDTSTSPNQITTLLLQNANIQGGSDPQPQSNTPSSPSQSRQPPTKRPKRDTTLADRPAYNSTLAPHDIRNGFSLAQAPTGLIVASGGDAENPVALFNQTANQWIDPTTFFGSINPMSYVQAPSSTPSLTPTSSPAPVAASPTGQSSPSSASASPSSPTPASRHDLIILGATLGAVFGTAALLLLALLIIRCIRRRKNNIGRRTRDFDLDSKHEMDFADQGADFMKEAGGSLASRHRRDDSGNSNTSVAIMSGTARSDSAQSKRGFLHKPGDSGGSSKSFFSRARSPLAPSPPLISHPVMTTHPGEAPGNPLASPEPRTEPRTAETGWSKYFNNNSSTNLGALPPSAIRHDSGSRPTTYTSQSLSDYESSRVTSSHPHESAEVQPLNLRASQPYPPHTHAVSPTSGLPLTGLAVSSGGLGHEPSSPSTPVSDIDEEDDYRQNSSQGQEHEGTAAWTPVERGSTWEERPISSVYADSVIYPHPGERVRIPNFPRVPSGGNSLRNSQVEGGRWIPNSATRDFGATGVPDRELPEPGNRRALPATGTSEARTFPRRPEELGPRGRGGTQTEDMSWLNLGK